MAARGKLADRRRFTEEAEQRQRRMRVVADQITRTSGISSAGFLLLGVAVLAWSVGYVIGGRPLYILSYASLVALVACWVVGRRPPPLTGERHEHRPRFREGEEMSIGVRLSAKRRLSNVILEERVPASLGAHARLALGTIEPGEELEHSYSLTCWRRGVFLLGPLFARWGDPMGLTSHELQLADEFEVLVHPAIDVVEDHPLTRLWEDPPFRPPVSKPWPHGLEFYGMRQYSPGDDLRRIVWRAYARTGQLLVRESEQGITDKIVIILDQSATNHSGGVVSDSFEAACRVAGAVGAHHLKQGYSVTLEGTNRTLVGPLRGGARIQLLDAIARAEPEQGSLAALLERQLATMPRDAHVVIVTPLLDAESAARLRIIVNRGQSVVVVALMWLDEAIDTLASAEGLGVRVIEVGPNTDLSTAFLHVGALR